MLDRIGVASAAELFADIPAEYREPELHLPPPLAEQELLRELQALVAANRPASELVSFSRVIERVSVLRRLDELGRGA